MDKLKQVQKYQFWIFLGVALILPFVGWIMGTSGMLAEAVARTTKLNELDKKLTTTKEDPNTDWERGLAEINVEQEKQKLLAWRNLYKRQKPHMVWLKEMNISDPEEIRPLQQEIYLAKYREAVEKIRQIVKPIVDDDPQTGLVVYPEELLPSPDEDWKQARQAPSRKQIEAAQEDLWLLEAVLKSIESVNRGSPSAYEAPIREITELFFRGGSPKGSGGSSSATSTANSAMPSGGHEGTMKNQMLGGMPRFGNMASDSGGGGAIADPKINADEELGAERPASEDKGDSKSTSSTASAASSAAPAAGHAAPMGMPMPGPLGGGGFGGARGGGSNMERYRDDQTEWKTRGFTLQVVMDHRRIPDLLVALSNCDWPINILRVHEADYKDEDLVSADGNGAGSGMMPMPGIRSGNSPFGPRGMSSGGMSAPGMSGPPSMGHGGGIPRGGAPPMPKASAPRSIDESGEGSFNTRSTMDDPNLANVSIVGVIYIFKKPPPPETAAPAAPQQTTEGVGQPAPGPAAATPAEAKPAADASDDSEPAKSDDEKPDEASDTPGDSSGNSSSDSSGDSPGGAPGGSTKNSAGGRG